jgi:hypothetical protein
MHKHGNHRVFPLRTTLGTTLFLLVSSLSSIFPHELAATRGRNIAQSQWLHVSSEHFDMISAVSEKQSLRLIVGREQFRILFLTLMNPGKPKGSGRNDA